MKEGDQVTPRARARRRVDQADARRLQRCERVAQVFHFEADVVQARTAAREELLERRVAGGGADLDGGIATPRSARAQERDVGLLVRESLAGACRQSEQTR